MRYHIWSFSYNLRGGKCNFQSLQSNTYQKLLTTVESHYPGLKQFTWHQSCMLNNVYSNNKYMQLWAGKEKNVAHKRSTSVNYNQGVWPHLLLAYNVTHSELTNMKSNVVIYQWIVCLWPTWLFRVLLEILLQNTNRSIHGKNYLKIKLRTCTCLRQSVCSRSSMIKTRRHSKLFVIHNSNTALSFNTYFRWAVTHLHQQFQMKWNNLVGVTYHCNHGNSVVSIL